jgi:hypothetical protein
MKVALATYLRSIPDGAGKSDGVKLGEAVAAKNCGSPNKRRL